MERKYALAHININGYERYLIRGLTGQGHQYISSSRARKESKKLVLFLSVEDIIKFLKGDSHVQSSVRGREALHDVPELFRLDPEFGEEESFRVYELDYKKFLWIYHT